MKKNLLHISQYSTMALYFLSMTNEGRAEAIYTDIDPDLTLDTNGDLANIDMNHDGINDFAFLNVTWTISDLSSNPRSYFERIWAGPKNPNNSIAGSFNQFTLSYGGLTTLYYPYALAISAPVGPLLHFQNAGYQMMAFRSYTYLKYIGTIEWDGGNWYPEVDDHYLGVRFIDTLGCTHYGWIRCDVKDEGRTLVIKDYAYESKCDELIHTGDTIGDTVSVSLQQFISPEYSIYSFSNSIYFHINNNTDGCKVNIFNAAGQLIEDFEQSTNDFSITLNDPPGIYLVQIILSDIIYSKKIYL